MNKQPFYHGVNIDCNGIAETLVTDTVKKCRYVLKDTVELVDGELLFTATEDVSNEAKKRLQKLGVKLLCEIECEAGDPADLM